MNAESVTLAERLARQVHMGQTDTQGAEYILHVERVAAAMDTPLTKAAAWLHDVVEDSPVSFDDLRSAGIPAPVVGIVDLLTRRPDEPYKAFMARLIGSGSVAAMRVKVADILDNLREGCPESLRTKRYEPALRRLREELARSVPVP